MRSSQATRQLFFFICRCCVVVIAALPLLSHAEKRNFAVLAGTKLDHDDNLYRRAPGDQVSEQIDSVYVGLKIDKSYSLQRFVIDGLVTDYQFRNNDYLNYRGKNMAASWFWALTPRLTGKLISGRSEQLSSFVDYYGTEKNVRKTVAHEFSADWMATGGWHVLGGLRRSDTSNGVIYFPEGDYQSRSADVGGKYLFASGNSITLLSSRTSGENANRVVNSPLLIDTGFEQTENFARIEWMPTGKSILAARLGRLERQHDHYPQRDFSGTVGAVDYSWKLDNRLRIDSSLRQNLVSFQSSPLAYGRLGSGDFSSGHYFDSSFYRSQVASVGPLWQLTPKTAVRLRLSYEQRDYLGGLLPELTRREDTLSQELFSLEWTPLQHLKLGVDYLQEARRSNVAQADFDSQTIGLTVSGSF